MANLQFGVRELAKKFYHDYQEELFNTINDIGDPMRALRFLQGIARSNQSSWSGGFSATNMEEQIKRELAIDMMEYVINKMEYSTKEAL